MAKCSIDECSEVAYCRGWCDEHYRRFMRTGSTTRPNLADRLARRLVVQPSGCVEWTGARNPYGEIWDGTKMQRAHRVAWELANGPIPEGMHVLHHCDNPPCCYVEHLFLGTHQDNMADRDSKGRCWWGAKPQCVNGHEFTEANTRIGSTGTRHCRECGRQAQARYRNRMARASG